MTISSFKCETDWFHWYVDLPVKITHFNLVWSHILSSIHILLHMVVHASQRVHCVDWNNVWSCLFSHFVLQLPHSQHNNMVMSRNFCNLLTFVKIWQNNCTKSHRIHMHSQHNIITSEFKRTYFKQPSISQTHTDITRSTQTPHMLEIPVRKMCQHLHWHTSPSDYISSQTFTKIIQTTWLVSLLEHE